MGEDAKMWHGDLPFDSYKVKRSPSSKKKYVAFNLPRAGARHIPPECVTDAQTEGCHKKQQRGSLKCCWVHFFNINKVFQNLSFMIQHFVWH